MSKLLFNAYFHFLIHKNEFETITTLLDYYCSTTSDPIGVTDSYLVQTCGHVPFYWRYMQNLARFSTPPPPSFTPANICISSANTNIHLSLLLAFYTPFTHSLSLFFLISLFSVDLWLDNIQLQNLMKCRWKEMCASKNITVKIKTHQQKVSQQNCSSFQITILESYKRSLTSCSHVPIDLEKSSLDILQKFSFCLPQNEKKVL